MKTTDTGLISALTCFIPKGRDAFYCNFNKIVPWAKVEHGRAWTIGHVKCCTGKRA